MCRQDEKGGVGTILGIDPELLLIAEDDFGAFETMIEWWIGHICILKIEVE